ncbi:hypothetical protein CSKR_106541, partial [Clonorchis sinensis]
NWNMRRPGAAHSVAWTHHKREIQLGSRPPHVSVGTIFETSQYIFIKETPHKVAENSSTAHEQFRSSCRSSVESPVGFDGKLTWNPAESLAYDVPKRPNVRRQATSCLIFCDIPDTVIHCNTLFYLNQICTTFANHTYSHSNFFTANPNEFQLNLSLMMREFTDPKVRGSNPTSASRLPLSRSGQPGSIPVLMLPSGGTAVTHRKSATAERFCKRASVAEISSTAHDRCHPSWGSSGRRSPRGKQRKREIQLGSRTPFWCLAAKHGEGSTRTEIMPGCPSLDRSSRNAEVVFEPRTLCELTGSNQTSASELLLSRLGQLSSIFTLVIPSRSMAAKHQKSVSAERLLPLLLLLLVETRGLRLPDEPQQGRNRPWVVENFQLPYE